VTGINVEGRLDIAELYVENLPKKSGERLMGCYVIWALRADRTAEKSTNRMDERQSLPFGHYWLHT
jgi:hypothetical protein